MTFSKNIIRASILNKCQKNRYLYSQPKTKKIFFYFIQTFNVIDKNEILKHQLIDSNCETENFISENDQITKHFK